MEKAKEKGFAQEKMRFKKEGMFMKSSEARVKWNNDGKLSFVWQPGDNWWSWQGCFQWSGKAGWWRSVDSRCGSPSQITGLEMNLFLLSSTHLPEPMAVASPSCLENEIQTVCSWFLTHFPVDSLLRSTQASLSSFTFSGHAKHFIVLLTCTHASIQLTTLQKLYKILLGEINHFCICTSDVKDPL